MSDQFDECMPKSDIANLVAEICVCLLHGYAALRLTAESKLSIETTGVASSKYILDASLAAYY